ncbi:S49 family peptidase [Hydrogenophaga sp.]|uniref:S49 family peptidase n=1 Tax=Hydrogenophaga sp. TaxID=1904254 RepID=UPI002728894A|nr:S49 family peptidase [Hydrogenophaga sp.]MDO8903972.1 S49 family peptidase [Hydrogenophaga sp.]
MTLIDLLRGAWAIQPDRLLEIQSIYDTHLRGEKIDLPALEARLGRPLASEQQEYRIREGGVAVLSIEGVLAPKANLFMRISGGVSTQLLVKQVESAVADPRVRGLILQVDSGGGSALGVPELSETIRELAAVKPIVTVTDGVMASGAYWLGSAGNAVFGSGTTVQVGSIGVVMTHNYTPNASNGQTTEITAGRYKRMATSAKPLDEEATAYLQQMVDHIYSVFVDAVAQNRSVTSEEVLQHMADGRVFIGQQAVDAGLLDGFATVDQVVDRMAANPSEFATRRKAKVAASAPARKPAGARTEGDPQPEPVLLDPPANPPSKETTMDMKTLAEQHPELLTTIQAEARAAGAKVEQERVAAVRAQSMKGHEALIEKLAADGKTTGPEAAMVVLAAERAQQEAAGKAFVESDAPAPAKTSVAPSDQAKTKTQQVAEAKAYAAEHKVDFITAMKKLGFAA